MKIASKTLLIIGIVFRILMIPYAIILALHIMPNLIHAVNDSNLNELIPTLRILILVSGILGGVLSTTIASLALWRLNVSSKKQDMIVWGILCIVFTLVVPGILILLLKDEDFIKIKKDEEVPQINQE